MTDVEERAPFRPADGIQPRWKILFDLVMSKAVGDEVTYEDAADALGIEQSDPRLRPIVQSAMRDAQAQLEKAHERTVGNKTNFGWIILAADQELKQVERRLVKTRKAAGRTIRGGVALNSRREELPQEERARLDFTLRGARMAQRAGTRRGLTLEAYAEMLNDGSAKAISSELA